MSLLHILHHLLELGPFRVFAGKALILVLDDLRRAAAFYKHGYIFFAHDELVFNAVSLSCPFGFAAVDGD